MLDTLVLASHAQTGKQARTHTQTSDTPYIHLLLAHTGTQTSDTAAPTGRVSYAKNGVWQGPAQLVPLAPSMQEGLYPHILLRNCQVSALPNTQKWPLLVGCTYPGVTVGGRLQFFPQERACTPQGCVTVYTFVQLGVTCRSKYVGGHGCTLCMQSVTTYIMRHITGINWHWYIQVANSREYRLCGKDACLLQLL